MTCNFRIGQKVVRVGGEDLVPHIGFYPEHGKIYTIRAINDHGGDCILLRFYEIDNSHMVPEYGSIEPGFKYSAFRPVVERKTDISIFKAMLNPSRVKETA